MEVYVYAYDLMVKSRTSDTHLVDLTETFQILKMFKMHLNPSKYTFRINSKKFLGFIIDQRRIYTELEKV